MPITIELPEAEERILRERADKYGQTLESFAAKLLARESRSRSIDEILAPFRQEVAESGMTEEEFGAFVEEIRNDIWEEKHGGKRE